LLPFTNKWLYTIQTHRTHWMGLIPMQPFPSGIRAVVSCQISIYCCRQNSQTLHSCRFSIRWWQGWQQPHICLFVSFWDGDPTAVTIHCILCAIVLVLDIMVSWLCFCRPYCALWLTYLKLDAFTKIWMSMHATCILSCNRVF
jgi:hypothetical protein